MFYNNYTNICLNRIKYNICEVNMAKDTKEKVVNIDSDKKKALEAAIAQIA